MNYPSLRMCDLKSICESGQHSAYPGLITLTASGLRVVTVSSLELSAHYLHKGATLHLPEEA